MIDPVALTQALVKCRSVTPVDDGALQVAIDALTPLGFKIERLRFSEDGYAPVDNIFARLGEAGPHLCYLGHTDVVPPGDEKEWQYPPFSATLADGKIYGRGTADMKGCNAAFISAIARYLNDQPLRGSISLLLTGDEEAHAINGTVKVIEWMQKNNQMPDVALVGEPSNATALGETMRIGRRGSLSGTIRVHGIQGHSAYPERADNPVPRLVRLVYALIHTHFDSGSEFFPPTNLVISSIDVGNPAPNIIPSKAKAIFNIRFNDKWTPDSLTAKINSVLQSTGEPYELDLLPCNATSFITKPGDWVSLVSAAVEKISGTAPKLDTGGGTSDARFIAPFCPTVEYGLLNTTIHKTDEHISVSDLEALTQTYLEILKKYFA